MIKILTIVGARPQFIKAAMVSRAIFDHNRRRGASPRISEEILHTGQHYDPNMSDIFFEQMHIPRPTMNLAVGSGRHGKTTGEMLSRIEAVILARNPDWVCVYGDTNSTLAGALAAVKLHVPVVHVEAGLRSFNKHMPEEINRILTDHVSSLLLCPTITAVRNLEHEGISRGVHHVGDVMYDAALAFGNIADRTSNILRQCDLVPKKYLLATVHRAENTDSPERLRSIFQALDTLSERETVVLPLHPRTRGKLEEYGIDLLSRSGSHSRSLSLIDPVSFLDMVRLEKNARGILTDSGGVQKEAYFHGVPCITLRDETEWIETVESGWNRLAGADPVRIVDAVRNARPGRNITEFGNGHSAEIIVARLANSNS